MGARELEWTLPVDAAMRDETPREAFPGFRMVERLFGTQGAERRSSDSGGGEKLAGG